MRVYLAGPDVFLPNPEARGNLLKSICAEHGITGIFPLDTLANEPAEWQTLPEPHRIARRNEAHIASCDALIANLTPFRGPSADVGTVFELGFMRALGRPVYGWSNNATPFADRTRAFTHATGNADPQGLQIEDFSLADNLMIEGAITASGGAFFRTKCNEVGQWTDLEAFRQCVAACKTVARITLG